MSTSNSRKVVLGAKSTVQEAAYAHGEPTERGVLLHGPTDPEHTAMSDVISTPAPSMQPPHETGAHTTSSEPIAMGDVITEDPHALSTPYNPHVPTESEAIPYRSPAIYAPRNRWGGFGDAALRVDALSEAEKQSLGSFLERNFPKQVYSTTNRKGNITHFGVDNGVPARDLQALQNVWFQSVWPKEYHAKYTATQRTDALAHQTHVNQISASPFFDNGVLTALADTDTRVLGANDVKHSIQILEEQAQKNHALRRCLTRFLHPENAAEARALLKETAIHCYTNGFAETNRVKLQNNPAEVFTKKLEDGLLSHEIFGSERGKADARLLEESSKLSRRQPPRDSIISHRMRVIEEALAHTPEEFKAARRMNLSMVVGELERQAAQGNVHASIALDTMNAGHIKEMLKLVEGHIATPLTANRGVPFYATALKQLVGSEKTESTLASYIRHIEATPAVETRERSGRAYIPSSITLELLDEGDADKFTSWKEALKKELSADCQIETRLSEGKVQLTISGEGINRNTVHSALSSIRVNRSDGHILTENIIDATLNHTGTHTGTHTGSHAEAVCSSGGGLGYSGGGLLEKAESGIEKAAETAANHSEGMVQKFGMRQAVRTGSWIGGSIGAAILLSRIFANGTISLGAAHRTSPMLKMRDELNNHTPDTSPSI